jgi:uncharacterized PurR-regulated membrane protein YhhQ (DUF165 family)
MTIYVLLYLSAIVAANLSIAAFGPSAAIVNAFVLIGLDLTVRDRLHDAWRGRDLWSRMALLILTGSVLSYLLNPASGRIAVASCAAFGLSSGGDALMYAWLARRGWLLRVNGSNMIGAALDSIIFPTLAFGALLPMVIIGQFAAKVIGGCAWSYMLKSDIGEMFKTDA